MSHRTKLSTGIALGDAADNDWNEIKPEGFVGRSNTVLLATDTVSLDLSTGTSTVDRDASFITWVPGAAGERFDFGVSVFSGIWVRKTVAAVTDLPVGVIS